MRDLAPRGQDLVALGGCALFLDADSGAVEIHFAVEVLVAGADVEALRRSSSYSDQPEVRTASRQASVGLA
ncbi:hypothetical protein [Candidatus Solirubrobacter pratensis]|uniref:hypothetical protein n=1 Tax=Candidatus Solirubrobacter pratensis TaxID=1298857 RepID=UPI00048968FF|nr:hypothetical protein [Candidatus Solirubrobacter pratensis]